MRKFRDDLRTIDLMTALEFLALAGFIICVAIFAGIKTGAI